MNTPTVQTADQRRRMRQREEAQRMIRHGAHQTQTRHTGSGRKDVKEHGMRTAQVGNRRRGRKKQVTQSSRTYSEQLRTSAHQKQQNHIATRTGNTSKKRIPRRQVREIVHVPESHKKPNANVPRVAKDTLRIIPIGGNEEVGRNMDVIEYGNDIVVVDIGMQFPEEDMPGIDYIVPNVDYLKNKKKNVRAVIFTHGHLDHIGAAPIVLEQLGYPPVIARDLTLALVKKKIADYDPAAVDRLKTISIKDVTRPVRLGQMIARFFEVEHSIMDSMGVALETPAGTAIHMGDWMINHDPAEGKVISYEHLKNLPSPRILMLESLGVVYNKAPKSEKMIQSNLETIIREAKGRIILGTFASQVARIRLILQYAQELGKKVALDGYSMRTNMEIAQELGYLNIRKDLLIPITEIDKYPDHRILILCTGAQGESNAALNRIVTDNHRSVKLKKTDTVVFSSSVIPGNERSVQRLKDNMYRKCDNVIHSDLMDIHIGGHATPQDIQEMIKMVDPQYFVPIYANHFMLVEAKKRAMEMGFPKDNVFVLDNGQVLDIPRGKHPLVRKERADASYVFIDGLGVGDIGHVVLRDRKELADDGMFVITVIIDSKTKRLIGNMQVTSRGFIFVKDNFDLINETKKKVHDIIKKTTSKDTRLDHKFIEGEIRDKVGEFLFQKTQRRPMVLPVVIEV